MKRNLVYVLAVLLISAASCSFTNKSFDNPDKDKLLIDLITYVLENGHFDPKVFNDQFSEQVYDNYIESLDPLKRYFLQSDIEEFNKYRTAIDDQIKTSDISFFNLTYERLMQRMDEASVMYKDVLETPFDYTKEETIDVDYDKLAYAKSKEELWQRWRKQLKFSTLERYASALEDAEDSLNADTEDNLIATDKVAEGHLVEFEEAVDTTGMPTDNPVALEKKTREATLTTLGEYFDFMEDLEREDWFSAYLNAIVGGF